MTGHEINSVQLIEVVREYPNIYDHQHQDYKCQLTKNLAWHQIGSRLFGEDRWGRLSHEERTVSAIALRKKWKNLKDSFARAIKTQIRETKPTGPYVHQKEMNFLIPVLFPDITHSDQYEVDDNQVICEPDVSPTEIGDETVDDPLKWESEAEISQSDVNVNEPQKIAAGRNDLSSPPWKRKRGNGEDDFNGAAQSNDFEADKMFLLSLLPSLNRIHPPQKLNVKIKILEAIREAQMPPP